MWVIADGPRPAHPEDQEKVRDVRNIIETGVDWPCKVRTVYAEKNLGCGLRISSGLDEVFADEEESIIIEDDCLPELTFFRFCDELLQYHRDNEQIAAVSGDNFQKGAVRTSNSYYYSRYPHCWGWATWRRAWKSYDHSMREWPSANSSGWLKTVIQDPREQRYWTSAFDRTYRDKIDTWDYRWTLACWRMERLTVLPNTNLVANIGFAGEGTHTRGSHPSANLQTFPMCFPLKHPRLIARHQEADLFTFQHHFRAPSIWQRITRKLRHQT